MWKKSNINDKTESKDGMTRDAEIPAIFNPKRVRAPSVVVTGDSPNGFSGFTNIINTSNPQITHQDSTTSSQPDGNENITGSQQLNSAINSSSTAGCRDLDHNELGDFESASPDAPPLTNVHWKRLRACKESCCSELIQKMYFGVCVTILVTASWVGATHCIKFLYMNRNTYIAESGEESDKAVDRSLLDLPDDDEDDDENNVVTGPGGSLRGGEYNSTLFDISRIKPEVSIFNAPFFASWFCTNFCFFFFPIYILGRISIRKCDKPGEILADIINGFRDRGFTIGRFLNRCLIFCFLWVATTYLYTMSLQSLFVTDVLALFATNVASVYLLSWVILHEQFVGVRIVAVILCDTGIALLAYMDGITESPTLLGVVLSALAAAGYAVFKVMFRKVMGDPPIGQVAVTFTVIGFLNAILLWPVCLGLYLSGAEVMPSYRIPWIVLLIASILLLVFHILTQFSNAVTYNMFVTLGLITAVPVSGALDVILYGVSFDGMRLAGVILIGVGFFLVMFPENWPDYITRLLRKTSHAILRCQCCCEFAEIEIDNSKYHLVGSQREMGSRSPQGFISSSPTRSYRLSHGLHSFTSKVPVRSSEMTDFHYQHQNQQQQQQQQQQHQQQNYNMATTSTQSSDNGIVMQRLSQQSQFIGDTASRYHSSYFECNDDSNKDRKKSETFFFNLGFRRKSTVFFGTPNFH